MLEMGDHHHRQQWQQPITAAAGATVAAGALATKRKNNGKSRLRNLFATIFNPNGGSKSKQQRVTTTTSLSQHQNQQSFLNYTPTSALTSPVVGYPTSKSHSNLLASNRLSNSRNQSSNYKQSATTNSLQLVSTNSLKRVRSSQFTAQQTSYEAMRTIDMYLIRQIARSCMDYEMEQKIELEIRLRELACQSLLEARDEIDVLEVEKTLLASDQRMNCYASQLEQQRRQLAASAASNESASSTLQRRPTATTTTASAAASASANLAAQKSQKCNSSVLSTSADSGRGSPAARGTQRLMLSTSDVVGRAHQLDQTYLSINDIDNINHSPAGSKLSPVSGQSADSAVSTQPRAASSGRGSIGRTASRSRTNPLRQQQQVNGHNAETIVSKNDNKNQQSGDQQRKVSNGSKQSRVSGIGNHHQSRSLANKKRAKLLLQQQIAQASNINCNIVTNNSATLSVSELRIPLMWRDVDHFKGRGDYRRYAIFCLLKINSQIYDTQLITDVDRQMTDVNFDDVIVFHEVDHDFELTLEVYSCVYLEEFSLSSTPRKLKEKLSNSVGRAMGRRLANHTASANFTRELDAYQDKSYRFTMIASASFRLEDAQNCVKTYDLLLVTPEAHHRRPSSGHLLQYSKINATTMTLARAKQHDPHLMAWSPWSSSSSRAVQNQQLANSGNFNSGSNMSSNNLRDLHKNTLPLFGHFCCMLTAKPDVFDKCVKTGYLRVASIQLPSPNSAQSHQGSSPTGSTGNDVASTSPDSAASIDHNTQSPTSSPQSTLMLRSALAASSKLATLSLQSASVYWALLRNFSLHLWPVDERRLDNALRRGHAPQVDISRRPPFTISIDKSTRLLRVSNSSLTIETDRGCFVIAIYDPYTNLADEVRFINQRQQQPARDEIAHWLRPIEQLIYDSHIWASALNHCPKQRQASLDAV